jgi:hypothetical protein
MPYCMRPVSFENNYVHGACRRNFRLRSDHRRDVVPITQQDQELLMLTVIITMLATLLVGGITLVAYFWYLTPGPRDRV